MCKRSARILYNTKLTVDNVRSQEDEQYQQMKQLPPMQTVHYHTPEQKHFDLIQHGQTLTIDTRAIRPLGSSKRNI